MIVKLWVEQFLRIELKPRWKEESGKYLDKNWIKAKKFVLIKSSHRERSMCQLCVNYALIMRQLVSIKYRLG